MNRTNLEIYAGDARTFTGLEARDYSNAIVNLTGYALTFRVGRPGCDAIFEKTGTITTAASGLFSVELDAADTEELSGDYTYQVAAVLNGDKTTVLSGRFRVKPIVEDI